MGHSTVSHNTHARTHSHRRTTQRGGECTDTTHRGTRTQQRRLTLNASHASEGCWGAETSCGCCHSASCVVCNVTSALRCDLMLAVRRLAFISHLPRTEPAVVVSLIAAAYHTGRRLAVLSCPVLQSSIICESESAWSCLPISSQPSTQRSVAGTYTPAFQYSKHTPFATLQACPEQRYTNSTHRSSQLFTQPPHPHSARPLKRPTSLSSHSHRR